MRKKTRLKGLFWGLPDSIQGNVTSFALTRSQDDVRMASSLMDQKVRRQADNKRKWENHSRDNHVHQQPFKRPNVARAYTAWGNEKKAYAGNFPYCNKCKLHHAGPCTVNCGNCKKVGYMTRDCKTPTAAATANQRVPLAHQKTTVTCYECRRQGHYRSECPKLKNQKHGDQAGNTEARRRTYTLGGREANRDMNVVTGTFLLNNRYVLMLFDTDADRSFVSTTFSSLIDIAPTALETKYSVELADGKIIGADTIIGGCTLNFLNRSFKIDVMPVELDSFNVIIGDRSEGGKNSRLNIISCTKTQKYIKKGCHVFLALITERKTEDKSKKKRLEDVSIVRDFSKVFPKDLPGLPPA
ncbi:putative reverse transcriptase domain-containing protein [Tanacetum coccineum]